MAFAIGAGDDAVTLRLNGDDLRVAESYEVKMSMLECPNAFNVRLGHGGLAKTLLAKYPKGTRFDLLIGGRPQFSGRVDAPRASGETGATEVSFRGRDWLSVLCDDEITDVRSYVDVSYADLVTKQLGEVGLSDRLVYADNLATRKIRSGVGVRSISEPGKTDSPNTPPSPPSGKLRTVTVTYDKNGQIVPNGTNQFGTAIPVEITWTYDSANNPIAQAYTVGGVTTKTRFATSQTLGRRGTLAGAQPGTAAAKVVNCVHSQVGDRRIHFLRKNLDHAGLILFASEAGDFVLGVPNTQQAPLFRFVRQRGTSANAVNITAAEWDDDSSKQFSECIIYGRNGGKKMGRRKVQGHFVNLDAYEAGGVQRRVFRDTNVVTEADATFYARRKMAEAAREGWHLTYTFAGHTAPSLLPGSPRAVLTMDTMCEVFDDELGIYGLFYIESCTYAQSGTSGTTTKVRLMRPDDLVFGVDE